MAGCPAGSGDAAQRVVRGHVERSERGLAAQLSEIRVARVECVRLAIRLLQAHGRARQVVQEQRVGLHQHRLALRMRLRCDGGAGQQAVRKSRGHRARFRRSRLRRVLHVPGDHLHVGADLAEHDDLRRTEAAGKAAAHRSGEEAVLAQALIQVRGKEERLVELRRLDLQPDLLVLLPYAEQPCQFLGIAADVGERPQRRRRCRRGRASGRARQALRVGDGLRRRNRGRRGGGRGGGGG